MQYTMDKILSPLFYAIDEKFTKHKYMGLEEGFAQGTVQDIREVLEDF